MKRASDFLQRFKNLTPPDDAVRRAVAEAVGAVVGVPATKKDVTVTRGVAFVKASSIAKSAIRTHRAEVLAYLYRELPSARDTVRDVR